MYEIGEELKPAVIAYLENRPLTLRQISLLRLYLKQWIDAPGWLHSPCLDALRKSVTEIATVQDIDRWLRDAEIEGIDPL